MQTEYSRGHMTRIMALDTLIFFIGLALFASPFVTGTFPGSLETTDHVALGALICILSIFRVLLAYGSIWIDVCLFALGTIVLFMPTIMHRQWQTNYNMGHLLGGGIIMGLSVIAAVITVPVRRARLHNI